ncbi:MAG: Putative SigmaB asociated two-component system sensor protein [uncultured Acetobacteraceae bacterium]|uniref:histidine kinase n=1 Tax=uncultured Acetobacteraceae bacterium TaxID=169975 RepID=A0A6J4H7V4_9PROT|nr:MAG: Putative SigmaB asociated two-component system sensor protein [uncultured Acetobacteraceae bacterium]
MTPVVSGAGWWPILSVPIAVEADVVTARQRARRVAELVGFDAQDQTRIATAVSEIARNAFEHGGRGRAQFALRDAGGDDPPEAQRQRLVVRVSDDGPGFGDLDAVLEGRHRSKAGLGVGLLGAKRLMDGFRVETGAGGSTVELEKALPRRRSRLDREDLGEVVARLARERAVDPLNVLSEQNRELVRSLDELKARQDELARLNQELEDTNRGVVALYAELDARAEQLRQASDLKSRFLSNMSHEFRTPLNSVLALSRLLLDRTDGELSEEQERQVGYIRKSTESLAGLVDDLLDLAKVEAGKLDVRPADFTAAELFGGLRGALKPLRTNEAVALVFEEPPADFPPLSTDEAKVAQVLRNFVSNALKFTPEGEVRVSAAHDRDADRVLFAVADTGIGIAPEDQPRVFEEFAQIENPLQSRAKGTGLGLPLSRRLAELLGGEIALRSEPGRGSVFMLSIPRVFSGVAAVSGAGLAEPPIATGPRDRGACVLVVDDDKAFRYALRQMLNGAGYGGPAHDVVEAADGVEGLRLARAEPRPDAILLDLRMPVLDGYAVLRALAADPLTRGVPVIVATSTAEASGADARLAHARAVLSKDGLSREALVAALRGAIAASRAAAPEGER